MSFQFRVKGEKERALQHKVLWIGLIGIGSGLLIVNFIFLKGPLLYRILPRESLINLPAEVEDMGHFSPLIALYGLGVPVFNILVSWSKVASSPVGKTFPLDNWYKTLTALTYITPLTLLPMIPVLWLLLVANLVAINVLNIVALIMNLIWIYDQRKSPTKRDLKRYWDTAGLECLMIFCYSLACCWIPLLVTHRK